jgi:hypothetical protein
VSKDLRSLTEDMDRVRDRLKEEQLKNVHLQQQCGEIQAAEIKSKTALLEFQTRTKLAEERAEYVSKMKNQEISIAEGKMKLEAEKLMESERSQV